MAIHVYLGIENLALNQASKQLLVDGLNTLGLMNDGLPHERNHWRVRNDNDAIIYEAVFDENTLTVAAIKARLAAIFGVSAASISHATTTPTLVSLPTTTVVFSRLGVDYLRMATFGLTSANVATITRGQSRIEVLEYLRVNAEAWDEAD